MSQNFNEFDFGQRIKEARQLKHLSQEQLGGLLKVSKATISNYEKTDVDLFRYTLKNCVQF